MRHIAVLVTLCAAQSMLICARRGHQYPNVDSPVDAHAPHDLPTLTTDIPYETYSRDDTQNNGDGYHDGQLDGSVLLLLKVCAFVGAR